VIIVYFNVSLFNESASKVTTVVSKDVEVYSQTSTITTIVLGHYTGQPALAGTRPLKNWRILSEQGLLSACSC